MAVDIERFLFGGGSADSVIDNYQKEAMASLNAAKEQILAQYPQMADKLNAEYDNLTNLIGQKGEQMRGELKKQIDAGQIRSREDLSRFFGGAPSGRIGAMQTKQSLENQQKLSDLMGGVRQEQGQVGLKRAEALTGLEREKMGTLAGLIGKEADVRTSGAQMKAQAAGSGGGGLLGSALSGLASYATGGLTSLLTIKPPKKLSLSSPEGGYYGAG